MTITQQIEQLAPEDKWALLSLLIDSLRRQTEPVRKRLCDYYGAGKGRDFQTAREVDSFIQEEWASWNVTSVTAVTSFFQVDTNSP